MRTLLNTLRRSSSNYIVSTNSKRSKIGQIASMTSGSFSMYFLFYVISYIILNT